MLSKIWLVQGNIEKMLSKINKNNALSIKHLTIYYRLNPVLWDITFDLPQGTLLGVAGPNGAGKTTLIKAILGLIKPQAGLISIAENLKNNIAYIPQRSTIDWDFPATVLDVALMGRYIHLGWFRRPQKKDYEIAMQALELVGMQDYRERHISQLSGGQQQRVFLARALAQDAHIYLLDEPFIGIDIETEKVIVQILKNLRDQGKTILVVHHDTHTLQEYFDLLLFLNVKLINFGPADTILNMGNIHNKLTTVQQ